MYILAFQLVVFVIATANGLKEELLQDPKVINNYIVQVFTIFGFDRMIFIIQMQVDN